MALDILSRPVGEVRLAPVAPRYAPLFGFALLTASCALASLALACATPFAAFAVIAAAMLPLRQALTVVLGSWLVNQGIGFGMLHYPIDITTMLWGLMIGAAALTATLAAAGLLRASLRWPAPLALTSALVCAYAAFEAVLLAAMPVLGGAVNFTTAIIVKIGLTSMAWLIGLVAICEIVRNYGQPRTRRTV
jgi:hypothetical protein